MDKKNLNSSLNEKTVKNKNRKMSEEIDESVYYCICGTKLVDGYCNNCKHRPLNIYDQHIKNDCDDEKITIRTLVYNQALAGHTRERGGR